MNRYVWLALVALGLLAPFAVYPVFMMKLLCFALFAAAFNLLLGYTGLLSYGHAAFFGGAAYVTGHLVKNLGLTPELGILGGTLFAGLLGYLVGSLAIRRQGIYFAMVTLALAQIVYFLALKLPFTGGEDGLQGIPRGLLFGLIDLNRHVTVGSSAPLPLALYYFTFALFCLGFGVIYRAIHSPFGQVLKAIRENEPRARSLGYKVERFKLIAFVLSSALAGMAGAMKCLIFQLASLTDVSWHTSGEVVLMTLLGGVGTVLGPSAGAFTVVTLQSQLTMVGPWITVIIGGIFVVCVLVFRRGFIGELGRLLRRPL